MRAKNWTLKMKLRVSQLIVKMMVLIILIIYKDKDVPGRKLKEQGVRYLLYHLLSLLHNPRLPVTSHLYLSVVGE
jgi:hypothetical protein